MWTRHCLEAQQAPGPLCQTLTLPGCRKLLEAQEGAWEHPQYPLPPGAAPPASPLGRRTSTGSSTTRPLTAMSPCLAPALRSPVARPHGWPRGTLRSSMPSSGPPQPPLRADARPTPGRTHSLQFIPSLPLGQSPGWHLPPGWTLPALRGGPAPTPSPTSMALGSGPGHPLQMGLGVPNLPHPR